MKSIVYSILFALFIGFLPQVLFAQEKTQAYYNRHENEILPDARSAFKNGDYERTVELCKWHYIIVGDRSAQSLRERAERCAQLSQEMKDSLEKGDLKAAQAVANTILSINPDDEAAKATVLMEDESVPSVLPDTIAFQPPVEMVVTDPPVTVEEQKEDPTVSEPIESPKPETVEEHVLVVAQKPQYEPHTRFVIKGGASILDLKQASKTIAPGGAIGVYDIGGSLIGVEVGGYVCPGLSSSTASLFGLDAALAIRAGRSFYPKAGVGFFSCRPTDGTGATTKGMCAVAGLTFLIGGHFCLELGAKYYPAVKLRSAERYSTSGVSYEFPSSRQILGGGIAPMVSLGLAF